LAQWQEVVGKATSHRLRAFRFRKQWQIAQSCFAIRGYYPARDTTQAKRALFLHSLKALSSFPCETIDEVLDEEGNVSSSFAQRRHFTVMIFTMFLILILSLVVVSGRYEMVFRNGPFVLSIILLRFSLTEDRPYGAPLALFCDDVWNSEASAVQLPLTYSHRHLVGCI
jgi:hypothetical protein